MKTKNINKFNLIVFVAVLLLTLCFIGGRQGAHPVFAGTMKTDSTPTPNPNACDLDCVDPDLAASHSENLPGFTQAVEANDQRLKIVFYWMDGCPQCEEVIQTILPEVEQKYGAAIVVDPIEVKTVEEVNQLISMGEKYGLNKETIGVPFILIGDNALSGKEQIQSEIYRIIDSNLNLTSEIDPETIPAVRTKMILILSAISLIMVGSIVVFLIKNKNRKTKYN